MRLFYLFLFYFIFFFYPSFLCLAQKTHWVTAVNSVSSELSINSYGTEFKASQIIGTPSIIPMSKPHPCAWSPNNRTENEFIKLQFEGLRGVQKLIIFENNVSGAIKKIFLIDNQNKTHEVNSFTPSDIKKGGNILTVLLNQATSYEVKGVEIYIDNSSSQGEAQIDAVGISDTIKNDENTSFVNDVKTTTALVKENIGNNINTRTIELAPLLSNSGTTLYFTRNEHPENTGKARKQDVWTSQFNGESWTSPVPLGSPINNDDDNAFCWISPDGKKALVINVYLPNGTLISGVSITYLNKNGEWTLPRRLNIQRHSDLGQYSEYTLSSNQKYLIFSSKRREGKGGKDIYISERINDTTYSEPINLVGINTAGNESTPFLAYDTKTLYFSSDGLPGYGGSDIFISKRLDDTWKNWSVPQNFGSQVNSPSWEGYFTIPADNTEYAYFCSSDKSIGKEDIFRLKLSEEVKPEDKITIDFSVVDSKAKQPVLGEIMISEIKEDKTERIKAIQFNPTKEDNSIELNPKPKLMFVCTKSGYLPTIAYLDVEKYRPKNRVKIELLLHPFEINNIPFQLKNILFQQSSYHLNSSNNLYLEVMAKWLKDEGSEYKITLVGHTDIQGDSKLNLLLSQKRVQQVKQKLVMLGINEKNILETKALGSENPLDKAPTEEMRRLNRRVEILISKP